MTKERPMIFQGPSVRAILSGEKIRSRRIIKLPAAPSHRGGWTPTTIFGPDLRLTDGTTLPEQVAIWNQTTGKTIACPYGGVGDLIWVKETWRTWERPEDDVDGIRFAADDGFQRIEPTFKAADRWVVAHDNDRHDNKWRPSIFMPRWASRITLQIAEVRVEHLQDITEDEARYEGVSAWDGTFEDVELCRAAKKLGGMATDRRTWFAVLWDRIHGDGAWDANPWVWGISFKRIEQATEETT